MTMKSRFRDLMAVADRAARGGDPRLGDTILKEVLHHDILFALQSSELSRRLVFQGGTALRLCYGNNRYSEDLDFVRAAPLEQGAFDHFKDVLTKVVNDRYGLDVRIADPKRPLDLRSSDENVAVHRWTAVVDVERPGRRAQKINIEVADVPAYDARPRTIMSHYPGVGEAPVVLHASSEREILADKVIAVVGRPYLKARDIWDIKWLLDRRNDLNTDWVRAKAGDYHLVHGDDVRPFLETLTARASELAKPDTRKKFHDEMSRFLAKREADIWIKDGNNTDLLLMDVSEYLERTAQHLESAWSPAAAKARDAESNSSATATRTSKPRP